MAQRTLAEIGASYDAKRELILSSIRKGAGSASLSGIEYYPKPWAELDMTNDMDVYIISTALTWNGDAQDHTGLRKLSPEEMSLDKRWSMTMREPCSDARNLKIKLIRAEMKRLRIAKL